MNLKFEVRRVCYRDGDFILSAGDKSDHYWDILRLQSEPVLMKMVARELCRFIPDSANYIASVEIGSIPLVTLMGQISHLPTLIVRKEPKRHGTMQQIEGVYRSNIPQRVVLVEDVISSGKQFKKSIKVLQESGLLVTNVACVVNRSSEKVDCLIGG